MVIDQHDNFIRKKPTNRHNIYFIRLILALIIHRIPAKHYAKINVI